jgi:hypothetical protein
MALKVYGWDGFRYPTPTSRVQTREIVAARSMAEVARILGVKSPRSLDLVETGNDREIAVAMAEPGVVFWQKINARPDDGFTRV